MFKTIAFATLMAASCAAHAVTTWTFSYTGFLEENTGEFLDTRALKGSFSGHDANGDGYVRKDEITSFFVNDFDYLACGGSSNEFYQCGTELFDYQIDGKLLFSAGIHGNDPYGGLYNGHFYTAGEREFDYHFTPFSSSRNDYVWTDATRFDITKSIVLDAPVLTVPEPGTWAMLATGLLLVAGAARRRQQQARPIRN